MKDSSFKKNYLLVIHVIHSFRFFFPENNFKYSGSVTISITVFIMSLAGKIALRIAGEGEYNPLPT